MWEEMIENVSWIVRLTQELCLCCKTPQDCLTTCEESRSAVQLLLPVVSGTFPSERRSTPLDNIWGSSIDTTETICHLKHLEKLLSKLQLRLTERGVFVSVQRRLIGQRRSNYNMYPKSIISIQKHVSTRDINTGLLEAQVVDLWRDVKYQGKHQFDPQWVSPGYTVWMHLKAN